jgi:tetratricopeptide (TPR) repeat protein
MQRKKLLLLSFLSLLLPPLAHAQAVVPTEFNSDKTPELTEVQKEFTNLPEQKRVDYLKYVAEATRLFNQKRIFEALEQIDEARKIFDRNVDIFNLLGSCYVEFRDFTKAREFFDKALALEPKSSIILFNVAELEFVTRNWQVCLARMKEVLPLIPEVSVQTKRIVELKMLLCYLALDMEEEAKALANKYDPLRDDSPFYYYAQASLCYRDKDLLKAEEFLQRANRVFGNPAYLAPWQDTLIEFGYIASFYGGDDLPSATAASAPREASPAPQPPPESGAK